MRLNLVATLLFSISGFFMAGLQANQHFLLPALAPVLYVVGQIFGALILSPAEGISVGPITFPGLGFGVIGLAYGVIIGALLHLLIQVPGLIKFHFRWKPGVDFKDAEARKVTTSPVSSPQTWSSKPWQIRMRSAHAAHRSSTVCHLGIIC
ncbi:hypothetical protein EOM89_14110, partial [Candidatus Falkowbacteria bacterium]|nr:hypothetical protein [Candidatus Falkowbacteria bacterium]